MADLAPSASSCRTLCKASVLDAVVAMQATVTAKDAKDTAKFESLVQTDFHQNRIPFLAQVCCTSR